MADDPRAQAHNALKQAERAAKRGALAEAERWSKTAERCAAAVVKLATTPPDYDMDAEVENEDRLREEIMGRIRRLADAQRQHQEWEATCADYTRAVAEAVRTGGPMPPPAPPSPFGGETELATLERIAGGD
ncbi:MAG: hypothetical protein H7124_01720 [Phycisphaerales bacterium]|nr:hypothetical protein [Hyphomonadaceae bacterium]